MGKTL